MSAGPWTWHSTLYIGASPSDTVLHKERVGIDHIVRQDGAGKIRRYELVLVNAPMYNRLSLCYFGIILCDRY